jgi:amino acid permease
MDELHIAVEILNTLRPAIWKKIISSLMLMGIVCLQFYNLPFDSKVAIKETMTSAVGLAALFFIWLEYYFSLKTYRKYQNTLISITELKAGS